MQRSTPFDLCEVKCDLLLALISFKHSRQDSEPCEQLFVTRTATISRGTFEGEVGAQVLCHFRYEHSLKCP